MGVLNQNEKICMKNDLTIFYPPSKVALKTYVPVYKVVSRFNRYISTYFVLFALFYCSTSIAVIR